MESVWRWLVMLALSIIAIELFVIGAQLAFLARDAGYTTVMDAYVVGRSCDATNACPAYYACNVDHRCIKSDAHRDPVTGHTVGSSGTIGGGGTTGGNPTGGGMPGNTGVKQ